MSRRKGWRKPPYSHARVVKACSELSDINKLVWLEHYGLANTSGGCTASAVSIGGLLGRGHATIERSRRELKRVGLLDDDKRGVGYTRSWWPELPAQCRPRGTHLDPDELVRLGKLLDEHIRRVPRDAVEPKPDEAASGRTARRKDLETWRREVEAERTVASLNSEGGKRTAASLNGEGGKSPTPRLPHPVREPSPLRAPGRPVRSGDPNEGAIYSPVREPSSLREAQWDGEEGGTTTTNYALQGEGGGSGSRDGGGTGDPGLETDVPLPDEEPADEELDEPQEPPPGPVDERVIERAAIRLEGAARGTGRREAGPGLEALPPEYFTTMEPAP